VLADGWILAFELDAREYDHRGNPHPHHQANRGAERPVGLLEIAEVRSVPRE
jgi:hypothetical protein